jgi:hypothetical protein
MHSQKAGRKSALLRKFWATAFNGFLCFLGGSWPHTAKRCHTVKEKEMQCNYEFTMVRIENPVKMHTPSQATLGL